MKLTFLILEHLLGCESALLQLYLGQTLVKDLEPFCRNRSGQRDDVFCGGEEGCSSSEFGGSHDPMHHFKCM